MNTKKPLYSSTKFDEPKLLGVYFNQDQTCFATCSDEGFKVFTSSPMEIKMNRAFGGTDNQDINTGIGIAKMLYKTNYIGLVGGGRRPKFPLNKLCIWDDVKGKNAIVMEFNTPILDLHLSRTHIVVVLRNSVLIYSFKAVPELMFSFETIDNERGVSDLQVTASSSILVFPARLPGQLLIVDVNNNYHKGDEQSGNKSVALIKAHKNLIQCVCLSHNGNLVASASKLGTLIRVHDTKTCSLIYEFRRGMDTAAITDMKFSTDGKKLAVLSDKNTIHIYHIFANGKVEENKKHRFKSVPLFANYFGSTWSFVSKNIGNKADPHNDQGVIGWINESSLVIVWKYHGIWEKYDIVKENTSDFEKDLCKWSIKREGWKSINN